MGTYAQATRAFIDRYLKEDLESVACPTISGMSPFFNLNIALWIFMPLKDEDWQRGTELIIDAYEETAEYTVLPLENTIYGPVTETLDCFFTRLKHPTSSSTFVDRSIVPNGVKGKGKGKEKEIIATLDLPIRHCLVVKKGVKMEDIRIVSSHEQVSLPFPP